VESFYYFFIVGGWINLNIFECQWAGISGEGDDETEVIHEDPK
jgi:hypothetical protein